MDELEKLLYDHVGTWLHELAWHCCYPINHSIALWSFLEAFRNHGFDIDVNNATHTVHFGKIEEVDRNHRFFEASLTYDQILNGWSRDVRAAPRTLYNSIHQVFDTMGGVLKSQSKPFSIDRAEIEWSKIRDSRPRILRQTMETYFLQYFNIHQEHVLMPVSGTIPDLGEPKLFSQMIQSYPLDVYRYAHIRDTIMKNGCRCGPCPETLVDMPEWRFSNSYHPSKSVMTDYFWGMYLVVLQKEKGYPFLSEGDGLRELVISGERAFRYGYDIKWDFKEFES